MSPRPFSFSLSLILLLSQSRLPFTLIPSNIRNDPATFSCNNVDLCTINIIGDYASPLPVQTVQRHSESKVTPA
jgi:hypothetical protein